MVCCHVGGVHGPPPGSVTLKRRNAALGSDTPSSSTAIALTAYAPADGGVQLAVHVVVAVPGCVSTVVNSARDAAHCPLGCAHRRVAVSRTAKCTEATAWSSVAVPATVSAPTGRVALVAGSVTRVCGAALAAGAAGPTANIAAERSAMPSAAKTLGAPILDRPAAVMPALVAWRDVPLMPIGPLPVSLVPARP